MSDQVVRLVVGGALLLHGLGHAGALGALLWIRFRPGRTSGLRLVDLFAIALRARPFTMDRG